MLSSVVSLCCSGLDAAVRLAEDAQPWHHLANVPFQILCTFLLLDTRESLSKVAQALATIRKVCECFPTPTMMNTVQTATHLVDLARQRKEQDTADLNTASSLQMGSTTSYTPVNIRDGYNATNGIVTLPPQTNTTGFDMSPGLVEADFSSWDNIDWDQVLRTNAMLGPFN